jgi:tRNA(Ile2) C34 agmatinyltransferase TiaS
MVEMFIGIDDTDLPGTRGTGRLARDLADYLDSEGAGKMRGITRHQLLLHPSINYTSHNSAACIVLDTSEEPGTLFDACKVFLKGNIIPGSDPGLGVATRSWISRDVIDFGCRAQNHILDVEQARKVAAATGVLLGALGPAGQGTIGAIAAVGLRGSGNDGRFIELRGIRRAGGVLSVRELRKKTDVVYVSGTDMVELAESDLIDTQDWLRPRLVGHHAVLVVEPHPKLSGGWISVDKRNRGRAED